MRRATTFRALQYRNYRYLWLGQTGHSATLWMDVIARSVLVLNLTDSAVWLSVVLAARTAPILVFGLIAGAVADRMDRRHVLISTQLVTWATYIFLGVAVVTGFVEAWHVVVTAAVAGTAMAFNQPVRQSLIPMLVPRDAVLNAVALNSTSVSVMRIGGSTIAGVLLIVLDSGGLYLVCAGIYGWVMYTTYRMRVEGGSPVAKRKEQTSIFADLGEGFAYLQKNPALALIVSLALILFVFGFPYQQIFVPLLAKETLDMGDSGVGWLTSAIGVGAVIGSLVVASRENIPRPALQMLINLFVFSGALLGIALLDMVIDSRPVQIAITGVLLAIAGSMTVTFMSFTNSLLLGNSDPEMHGRVMSLLSLDRGLIPLGAILAGLLASSTGVLTALLIMGSVVLGLSLLALVFMGRSLRTITATGERAGVIHGTHGPALVPPSRQDRHEKAL
jgi:MFS family permease